MIALFSILALSCAAGSKPNSPPPPQVYFTLLDASGASKVVTVQAIDGETISTTDLDGRRRNEPLSTVILLSRAMIQPPQMPRFSTVSAEDALHTPRGVLHTVDGQIVAGSLTDGGKPEEIMWQSPVVGTLRVPLEMLRRLDCVYPPSAMNAQAKFSKDTLMLRNGDVIGGFVDSIGELITIETGTAATKSRMTVPMGRVEAVVLAQAAVASRGTIVTTREGLVVQIQSMQIQDRAVRGKVTLRAERDPLVLQDVDVESLVIDAARVLPLSQCSVHDVAGTDGRGWTQPLAFHQAQRGSFATELEFPGPMRVDFDVPKGATRLLFHAELPHSCRTWGDPELVVSAGDGTTFKELKRISLTGDAPEADANLEIGGANVLRFSVEAGAAGAIQDRVTLRRAMILFGSSGRGEGKNPVPNQ